MFNTPTSSLDCQRTPLMLFPMFKRYNLTSYVEPRSNVLLRHQIGGYTKHVPHVHFQTLYLCSNTIH
jgi:hypothetical protein